MEKQQYQTAPKSSHQLWVDRMCESIVEILFSKKVRTGKVAFMTSKESIRVSTEKVLAAITAWENTRIRVIVDAFIKRLDALRTEIDLKGVEYQKLHPFFQFKARARVLAEAKEMRAALDELQKGMLFITNTPPPEEQKEEEEKSGPKPSMKIVK